MSRRRGGGARGAAEAKSGVSPISVQLLIQFSHPDVSEADGLAEIRMGRQFDRRPVVFPVERFPDVGIRPSARSGLHQHTVKEHGCKSRASARFRPR